MTKKLIIKKESDTSRLVNDDQEVQSGQLKFSIEEGSISLRSEYGVIHIKDGTLALSSSVASISTTSSSLKSDQEEDIFTIKDGSLTIRSSPASVLGESGIIGGDLMGKDPFTIESTSKSLFVESGVLQSGVESALSIKDVVFTLSSATDLLLAEDVIVKPGTKGVFSIKEGAFTAALRTDPHNMKIGGLQAGAGGTFTTKEEISSVVVTTNSPLSQSKGFQSNVGDVFTIIDGAFIVAPSPGSLHTESFVLQTPAIENTMTVKNGVLVASPTDRLLMGENALLGINPQLGTLTIRDDAFEFATKYTGSVHLMGETQKVLSSIEWSHVGDGLRVDILDRTRIQDSFLDLSDSYSRLFMGVEDAQPGFCSLPSSIANFPPDEYFHSANLLNQVTYPVRAPDYFIDGIQERKPQARAYNTLLTQLEDLDVGFGTMLQGAVGALRSDNPDKVRHFSISLRELFTHVLHRLSPDDAVKKWSTSNDDFHNSRPTRRARLKYICREINQASFEKFVEADIDALLELLSLFQGGTHELRPEYTDSQLKAMRVRMENALRFLIETSIV